MRGAPSIDTLIPSKELLFVKTVPSGAITSIRIYRLISEGEINI